MILEANRETNQSLMQTSLWRLTNQLVVQGKKMDCKRNIAQKGRTLFSQPRKKLKQTTTFLRENRHQKKEDKNAKQRVLWGFKNPSTFFSLVRVRARYRSYSLENLLLLSPFTEQPSHYQLLSCESKCILLSHHSAL